MHGYPSHHEARMQKATQFFYEHAGFSYDPKTETAEEGRLRCARELAQAEYDSSEISFDWQVDDCDSSEWSDEQPPYAQWVCFARDVDSGRILASLGGIDFGRDSEPYGDPYMRVVEAELALEILATA